MERMRSLEDRHRRLSGRRLSYPEIAATRDGVLPDGYEHVQHTVRVGSGPGSFQRAAAHLRDWGPQRAAGMDVYPPGAWPEEGATVLLCRWIGLFRVAAPCRVLWVLIEARRAGFAYGTLPGHAERGETAFLVELGDDGEVRFTVRGFSRLAGWYARLCPPLARWVRRRTIEAFVRSMA
jgi:uncharacterized protein (UPF0548 family)